MHSIFNTAWFHLSFIFFLYHIQLELFGINLDDYKEQSHSLEKFMEYNMDIEESELPDQIESIENELRENQSENMMLIKKEFNNLFTNVSDLKGLLKKMQIEENRKILENIAIHLNDYKYLASALSKADDKKLALKYEIMEANEKI